MEIVENCCFYELIDIFNQNNQDFVSDKDCLLNNEFLKVVATENGFAIGYLVLYFGNDFIKKEKFDLNFAVENNSAYIWHCITKKGFEGKGIQSAIFEYVFNKFSNNTFYSVVDVLNKKSLNLHKKFNFNQVAEFQKKYNGKICNFLLMKHVN